MSETVQHQAVPLTTSAPYDKRKLSYANTFSNPWKANTIRAIEWSTGKLTLLRLVRRFEKMGPAEGQAFWGQAFKLMGIDVQTPSEQIARIPKEGPIVIVSNHPHGLLDGMLLAELIGHVRQDYKILTRSLLTGVREIEQFMIPVPFPHESTALAQSLEMRARTMEHLKNGGVIALFPSGAVASSKTPFGPVVEDLWNPFTSKIIQKSGATVVPIFFPGQNSRAYQLAARFSATVRQGLLIHEVVHACWKSHKPIIGHPISPEEMRNWNLKGRNLVEKLRKITLALGSSN
jgi:putative hemolysin